MKVEDLAGLDVDIVYIQGLKAGLAYRERVLAEGQVFKDKFTRAGGLLRARESGISSEKFHVSAGNCGATLINNTARDTATEGLGLSES